ncbi:MAG: hypothetical protein JO253_06615, partial [Alphaproteobacteria bacterium]|nr:hypothetical protein [Alphaproteobacteria bacterium]
PADPLPVQKAIVNLEADGASNQNAQEKTNVQDSQVHSGDLIKRPDAIGPSTSTEKTEQNAAGAAVGLGVGIGINSALDDGKSKNQNQVSVTGSVTDVHKDESQGTKIGGSSVNIQQGGQ